MSAADVRAACSGMRMSDSRVTAVLAQALAQAAPVLLLDEPTTHLDIRHVVDVLDRVRGLARREGRAVLAVFHDLNLAAACIARKTPRAVCGEGSPERPCSPAT